MGSGKQFSLIQVLGGSLRHMNGIIALLTRIVKGKSYLNSHPAGRRPLLPRHQRPRRFA